MLPQAKKGKNVEDIEVVVPNRLQMGWYKSPPLFWAASETAIYVIDTLLNKVNLQGNPFEERIFQIKRETHGTA